MFTSDQSRTCLFVCPTWEELPLRASPVSFGRFGYKLSRRGGTCYRSPPSNGDAKSMTSLLSQFAPSGVNIILLSFTHLGGLGF